jgi:hypothetical protein
MKNKEQKWVYYLLLILIIIGGFLPLYTVEYVTNRCTVFNIVVFLTLAIVSHIIFNSSHKKFIVLTHIILAINFIIIWSQVSEAIDIANNLKLNYRYGLGFYFLLVGIFGSLIYSILYKETKNTNTKKKRVKYNYNKITGAIEKVFK